MCLVRLALWVLWDQCPSGLSSPCSIRDMEANLALRPACAPSTGSFSTSSFSWCCNTDSGGENSTVTFCCSAWRSCVTRGPCVEYLWCICESDSILHVCMWGSWRPGPGPLWLHICLRGFHASIDQGVAKCTKATAQKLCAAANPTLAYLATGSSLLSQNVIFQEMMH